VAAAGATSPDTTVTAALRSGMMRHLLLPRMLLRRRSSAPSTHHHHLRLLRALSSGPSPVSSDADLRKYAGYALLLLGCGAATYYSFPFPADALHKKAVPFKYAPLPDDLHAVSNWSGTHEVHTRVLPQPDSAQALQDALAAAHKDRRKLRPLGSGLSPNGLALTRAGMVNLALMDKVLHVDAKKKTVTVQAGIRVAELVDALREHGLTLQNFASIREQQVGGFTQVCIVSKPSILLRTNTLTISTNLHLHTGIYLLLYPSTIMPSLILAVTISGPLRC
jgi:L-galactono-1,4-lactone dehydrogenase